MYGVRGKVVYQITLEIQQLPEGPFLGTSPELPGLIVQAETVEEVVSLAPGIAKDLIEVMRETRQPFPYPPNSGRATLLTVVGRKNY